MYTAEEVIEKEDTKAKVEKAKKADANREVIDIDAEMYEEEPERETPKEDKKEEPKEEPKKVKKIDFEKRGSKLDAVL